MGYLANQPGDENALTFVSTDSTLSGDGTLGNPLHVEASGTGDMTKAVYDPANGAKQVAFADQIPSVSGLVPYTGGTGALSLNYNISSNGYNTISSGPRYLILSDNSLIFRDNFYFGSQIALTVPAMVDEDTNKDVILQNKSGTIALLEDIPTSTTFVPYTGATADVDLGSYQMITDTVKSALGVNLHLLVNGTSNTVDMSNGGLKAKLDFSFLTSSDRTFKFPDHDGTFLTDGVDIDMGVNQLTTIGLNISPGGAITLQNSLGETQFASSETGILDIFGGSSGYGRLDMTDVTVDRLYTFPDKDGTVAMLSDIISGISPAKVAARVCYGY
jgi:hypothetical protein